MKSDQSMRRISCVISLLLASLSVSAQEAYPSKPIRVVVPAAPGGAQDFVVRVIGEKFQSSTGQPLVLENRGGASGIIGAETVLRAAPDGYTLLAATIGVMSLNPHTFKRLPYDPAKSFVPVTQLINTNYLFLVHSSIPATNLKEFVAWAKASPGKISFGSSGVGTPSHFAGAMVGQSMGIELLHVPYKGVAPAFNDLLAGQVNTSVATVVSAKDHIRSGKLRVLAVASARRVPALPEVPTFAELGYPNVIATLWLGLVAPAGTPGAMVDKLHMEIAKALDHPDVREKLLAADQEPVGSSPSQFAEFLKADSERWRAAVKASGFTAIE